MALWEVYGDIAVLLEAFAKWCELFENGAMDTVSYTHLDVYKRQRLYNNIDIIL